MCFEVSQVGSGIQELNNLIFGADTTVRKRRRRGKVKCKIRRNVFEVNINFSGRS